ncbi:MAG: hypothetical protein AAF125_24495 [Chloroflexota bacterium]
MIKQNHHIPVDNTPTWLQTALFKQPFAFRTSAAPNDVADTLRSRTITGWTAQIYPSGGDGFAVSADGRLIFSARLRRYPGLLLNTASVYVAGTIEAQPTGETVVRGYTRFSLWIFGESIFASMVFALMTYLLMGGWGISASLWILMTLAAGGVVVSDYWRASNDRTQLLKSINNAIGYIPSSRKRKLSSSTRNMRPSHDQTQA